MNSRCGCGPQTGFALADELCFQFSVEQPKAWLGIRAPGSEEEEPSTRPRAPPPDPRRRVLRKGRSGFALPAAPARARPGYRSLRAARDDSESEYEDDDEPRCRPVLRMKDNVRN